MGAHHRYGSLEAPIRDREASLRCPYSFDPRLTSTVSSAGVTISPSIPFQPYTKPRANVQQRPGRSRAIATTEVLLHSSAHPKLDYTVREEETQQRHYVGVYDPATGKLEVTEARKMEVRAAVREHQATEEQVHQVCQQGVCLICVYQMLTNSLAERSPSSD